MTTQEQAEDPRAINQILGTMALSSDRPVMTEAGSQSCNESERLKKRQRWLDKWLKMAVTHPQVETARNVMFKFCCEYSKNPNRGRTLVIIGENGCGKTHIARCVAYWARSLAIQLPLVSTETGHGLATVEFVNWAEIVDNMKRGEWDRTDDLRDATLTILDDIGAEHDPSKVGAEKFYVLLNRREFKWNLITTNVNPANWEERFERRIASRLNRNAEHLDMTQVPDYSTT